MESEKYKFEKGELKVKIADKWKSVEFKKYKFLEVIGEGANGVVIKAKHQVTDRIDAIKIWLPHKKSHDGYVSQEQYLREIKKISKLKDKHIVTVYDAEYNDGIHMCSMEYIEGESLEKWCQNNYNLKKRIKICYQILKTVENYQKEGIIHGDLHSRNILVDKDEQIYIIDFGTSLFGRNNQSKERETYVIYDTVQKVLGEEFKEELFVVKNYTLNSKCKYDDDIRIFNPLLITRTMLQFVKLRNIKEQTIKMTDRDVLIEYCENIAKGIYFDLGMVYSELLSWSDLEFVKPIFGEIIYRNIEHVIFELSESDTDELIYITLYIYYEIFNDCKGDISIDKCKKHFMNNYIGFLSDVEYDEYINDLYKSNYKSYIEYSEHLNKRFNGQKLYYRENRIRTLLFDLIETHYEQRLVYVLYDIWKRLNEIRVNEKLYREITRLSEVF